MEAWTNPNVQTEDDRRQQPDDYWAKTRNDWWHGGWKEAADDWHEPSPFDDQSDEDQREDITDPYDGAGTWPSAWAGWNNQAWENNDWGNAAGDRKYCNGKEWCWSHYRKCWYDPEALREW